MEDRFAIVNAIQSSGYYLLVVEVYEGFTKYCAAALEEFKSGKLPNCV